MRGVFQWNAGVAANAKQAARDWFVHHGFMGGSFGEELLERQVECEMQCLSLL